MGCKKGSRYLDNGSEEVQNSVIFESGALVEESRVMTEPDFVSLARPSFVPHQVYGEQNALLYLIVLSLERRNWRTADLIP